MAERLAGIVAAMPTPLTADRMVAFDALPVLLDDLVAQGCHGALVLGSTGEGPSFGLDERRAVLSAVADWRAASRRSDFRLLGGTGCANVPETITLSRHALAQGYDALLVVPPFYFKGVGAVGVARAYAAVLEGLPEEARVLLYHIPGVTGVTVGVEVLTALRSAFGPMVAGLKDSGGDLAATLGLIRAFPELAVFTGTDSHLLPTLGAGGAGAITALASVCGATLRAAYEAHQAGQDVAGAGRRLEALRDAAERYPLVAGIKALAAVRRGLPLWPVRPPLVELRPAEREALAGAVAAALDG
jgi:4-hydroxy-tetrahydrodipicolinate synthase